LLKLYRSVINRHHQKTIRLETDLHEALEQKQFIVYYQPFIEVKTNKICGMESLLRWPASYPRLIPPVQFIPLAEETGLIVPIVEWIMRDLVCNTNNGMIWVLINLELQSI